MKTLIIKSTIVGVSAVIVGFLTTRALTGNTFPKMDDKNINIMLFNYFLSAVILNIIFQYTGVSSKLCNLV
jgi:hypothetical protein